LTARTLTAGPHISQGESFYPGLVVEEQAEAYRDGSLIAWGDEEDEGGGLGTTSAGGRMGDEGWMREIETQAWIEAPVAFRICVADREAIKS
jgi:hypothetical protein